MGEEGDEGERRRVRERLGSLVVPEVDVAVEAGALLEQIQELWREPTLAEERDLLAGMVEAVHLDLPSPQWWASRRRAPSGRPSQLWRANS
jgi:site-specific DNA recombinase